MAETYLVPVDFSPPSEVGLDYALKLAKEKKARVILLHVITSAAGNRLRERSLSSIGCLRVKRGNTFPNSSSAKNSNPKSLR
jgi:nucleotide-binding universal stress UspA family protein